MSQQLQPCLGVVPPTPAPKRRKHEAAEGFEQIESMDASDYLARVMKEAKGMPDVFVSEKDGGNSSGTNKKKNVVVSAIDGSAASLSYLLRSSLKAPPSSKYLPSNPNLWMESVVSNFEELRSYLEDSKAKGFGGKGTNRLPLPAMKDKPSWHVFCVGSDAANGNEGSYFGDDENGVTYDQDWSKALPSNGYEPTVRLLLQMDQVMIRRVLSHMCHYVHLGWSVTGKRGKWIYALLARLEKPLHRDDAALLFGLLKDLTVRRSQVDASANRNHLAQLNVLIVLIGVYFEQGGTKTMSI